MDGRIAIVTGASRGIGEEIALLLTRKGARVVCAARTLNEGDHRLLSGSLSGAVGKIKQAGGQAIAVAADVSREEDCPATRTCLMLSIVCSTAAPSRFVRRRVVPWRR